MAYLKYQGEIRFPVKLVVGSSETTNDAEIIGDLQPTPKLHCDWPKQLYPLDAQGPKLPQQDT